MSPPAVRFALVPYRLLTPHEEVDDKQVGTLSERLKREGTLYQPIVADGGSLVILDGHHRFAALDRLGCSLVPCHLVDYHDPGIRVEHWDDGTPMDKTTLISDALAGTRYPIKTSRHRALSRLSPRPTPLAHLHQEGGS